MNTVKYTLLALAISLISCKSMKDSHKHTNALINETSPYLLQHAHNPVDWHPWNEATLAKAKKENKLMIISVGYSACHWCHVMEHESFEDSLVANIMNENFLPIKVDREELPNVDDVYMTACQLTNNRGCGWPLNAFALPDGRPFWAGTYFPKDQWIDILNNFIKLRDEKYDKLEESADYITKGISQMEDLSGATDDSEFVEEVLDTITVRFLNEMDMLKGGKKGAPKFPMPSNIEYLLEYYHSSGNETALDAAITSLDQMAQGGIYDQLGGGFARYSVDDIWLVPHFEKMLYDNSQLVSLYSHAYQLTKKELYKKTIIETLDFVERELTSNETAFYSALDADSEGEEGKFYVWDKDEVLDLFDNNDEANIFCDYFEISEQGNWEHKNILRINPDIDVLSKYKIDDIALSEILKKGNKLLMEARDKRIRPGLDDKVLTSWNGLMLNAYVQAYTALGDSKYLDIALKNAAFIDNKMTSSDFRLDRNYKNNKSNINAFLDDYATVINAYINLYQVTFDTTWLDKAEGLTQYVLTHFHDKETHLFFYTSDIDPALVARKKELSDNVIPASNSMMAKNLFNLGTILYNKEYLDLSKKMTSIMSHQFSQIMQPSFYSNWLSVYLRFVRPPFEIAIMGKDAQNLRSQMAKSYLPNTIFMGSDNESELPLLKEKYNPDRSLIYVCQNKVCKFPVETVEKALEQIDTY